MKPVRAALPMLLLLVATLALGGCMARLAGIRPAPPLAQWWRGMGDAPLSGLIERRLAQTPALGGSQVSVSVAIARQYITLRARQTALVLLAAREELDAQLVIIAQQPLADGTASRQRVALPQAQLDGTRADQARIRTQITGLRDGLAMLAGAAPAALDALPGGPIPLPPAGSTLADDLAAFRDAKRAFGRYRAASLAEDHALTQAAHERARAALQELSTRAGTSGAAESIVGDLQALAALQAEEDARAAMTQAYVMLVQALGRHASSASASPEAAKR